MKLSVAFGPAKHPSLRIALLGLLILTVVVLGAAAKRSQYPSANHRSTYLAQSVKMNQGPAQPVEGFSQVPPAASVVESIVAFNSSRDCGALPIPGTSVARLELQFPPLLV